MAPSSFKLPFQEVQDEVSSRNLQKIKEKNVSKCSLTIMAPSPFKLPFPRSPGRSFQPKSTKNKRKER